MKKIVLILILVVITNFLTAQSGTCLSGNCQNGKGSMQTSYGVYEGQFVNGKMSGKGIMKQGDGAIYSGMFVNNQYNGKGAMKYANGDVYKGYWQNNMRHGNGIIEFADGRKFKGKFVNDDVNGPGLITNSEGKEIKKGNFVGMESISSGKSLPDMTKKLEKSIVFIYNFENGQIKGLGTGFVIGNRYIATNEHVVSGNGYILRMHDAIVYSTVEKVYTDLNLDLAILKVKDNLPFNYTALEFGRQLPEKGEDIFTIGNPKGYDFTLSEGVISAFRPGPSGHKQIQITAAISPGSSGSPLFNKVGKVIGIVTEKQMDGESINIAYDLLGRKDFLEKFK